MRDEIKVETCEVVWNMARQCHEITIVGERDGFQTRIFLTDLGENYETRLQREETKCERLEEQLKEANELLWKIQDCREDREYYSELAYNYLEKWGVK
jgi:hypothetical protein